MMVTKNKKELIDEHFCYEVIELRSSLILFSKLPYFKNIALEAFILHVRVLREFFFPSDTKKRRIDDAYADEFVIGWNESLPLELKKIDERAGKEIMHLTYSRIAGIPQNKKWNMGTMYFTLIPIILKFMSLLPIEYRSERIIALESELNKIHSNIKL